MRMGMTRLQPRAKARSIAYVLHLLLQFRGVGLQISKRNNRPILERTARPFHVSFILARLDFDNKILKIRE
jgi:hypothetical protein